MTAMDSQWEAVQHSIHSVAEAIVAIKQNLALAEPAANGDTVRSGSGLLPGLNKKENDITEKDVPLRSQASSKRCFQHWANLTVQVNSCVLRWLCHAGCTLCIHAFSSFWGGGGAWESYSIHLLAYILITNCKFKGL